MRTKNADLQENFFSRSAISRLNCYKSNHEKSPKNYLIIRKTLEFRILRYQIVATKKTKVKEQKNNAIRKQNFKIPLPVLIEKKKFQIFPTYFELTTYADARSMKFT